MGHGEVMRLPLRTFWFMDSVISRVRAEEDIRSLRTINAAQAGAKEHLEHLVIEIGSVIKNDPLAATLDEAGMNELRAMAMM